MALSKDVLLFGSSSFLLVGDFLLGGIDAEDLYVRKTVKFTGFSLR